MGLPGLVRDISACQNTLTCFKQSPESFEYFVEKKCSTNQNSLGA